MDSAKGFCCRSAEERAEACGDQEASHANTQVTLRTTYMETHKPPHATPSLQCAHTQQQQQPANSQAQITTLSALPCSVLSLSNLSGLAQGRLAMVRVAAAYLQVALCVHCQVLQPLSGLLLLLLLQWYGMVSCQ